MSFIREYFSSIIFSRHIECAQKKQIYWKVGSDHYSD